MLTVFSWGYDGWGNSTRQLLQATAAIEHSRGFEPPVFVDIRARRGVRAEGFRDDAFERRIGHARYRWMPGLGNAAIATGRGKMRLVEEADSLELLGLILAQQKQRRRVIFFCACASPHLLRQCHRWLVAKAVKRAARHARVAVQVEEWPGGRPSRAASRLQVRAGVIEALRRGGHAVRLGAALPPPKLLALPHGSLVDLRDDTDKQLVSVCEPKARAGRWEMELFAHPAEEGDSAALLKHYARRFRKQYGVDEPGGRG